MSKEKAVKRFEVFHEEKIVTSIWDIEVVILRDKFTGVLYLTNSYSDGGGITPLLGRDGRPIIDLSV